jgi:acetyl esterase/lipase
MPVTPDVERLLGLLQQGGFGSLSAADVHESRRRFETMAAVGDRIPVGAVEDTEVPGGDGPRPARIYRPASDPVATVVFFHGGGFAIGSIETHDNQVRRLCRDVHVEVVSVGYRLAPENPWPAAVEDALAATRWALGRHERIVVGGDSAGGNLAAVVAQQLRGEIAAQLLMYPAVDLREDVEGRWPSRTDNSQGYFLTEGDLRFFENHYAAGVADRADPRLSPLLGDLLGVPPAVVVTAEYDPLRDEGDAYAEALERAGVRVEHRRFEGLIHGFFGFGGPVSPSSDAAAAETCALLAGLL